MGLLDGVRIRPDLLVSLAYDVDGLDVDDVDSYACIGRLFSFASSAYSSSLCGHLATSAYLHKWNHLISLIVIYFFGTKVLKK